MDHFPDTKPQGAFSALLADQDLTHLELVLRRSLSCDLGGPLLPPSYWRERLASIMRQSHLSSHTQIQTVHRLYLHIDALEAAGREEALRRELDAPPARISSPPRAASHSALRQPFNGDAAATICAADAAARARAPPFAGDARRASRARAPR
ncbi:MAG: hypothetical protein CBHOC_3325 [uncultured Caballeronia sp.]|nr:MAG: hypothetical protein CBHOC_3325 [uncultured Caballeronia sp.]